LSYRQWQALLTGLSWSRENRSVPINEWLERLGLVIEPHQLPSRVAVEPAFVLRLPRLPQLPSLPRLPQMARLARLAQLPRLTRLPGLQQLRGLAHLPPVDWPKIALPASFTLLAMVALFAFHRAPPRAPVPLAAKPLPVAVVPVVAASAPPVQTTTAPSSAALPAPSATVVVPRPVRSEASFVVNAKPSISLTSKAYFARHDTRFVEVRVRRTDLSTAGQRFTWWTENGTATAGVDFTPQGRITRVFSDGRQFATLFIRLNPTVTRREAATFYVNIADPGTGTTLGALSRAAVVLPTMR
jgi:hypothetical protein